MNPEDQLTPQDLEQLATEHAHLADTIAHATARQKEIKATLADHLTAGKHQAGPYSIQITIPRKFDKAIAEQTYPVDRNPEYYSLQFDQKKLQASLPPILFDQLKTDGTPTVTVK